MRKWNTFGVCSVLTGMKNQYHPVNGGGLDALFWKIRTKYIFFRLFTVWDEIKDKSMDKKKHIEMEI